MIVRDAMSRSPVTISPRMNLQDAALQMKRQDVGILPIVEDGEPVGILTDRDLVLRGLADGRDPKNTAVREIMTQDVVHCKEVQQIEDACNLMERYEIRRLVVTGNGGEIVGLLSLDDVARKTRHGKLSGVVLHEISSRQAET